ncbi:MAG: ABC transporter permease, partial [Candidatus Thorarchaeota archaeon]
MTEPSKSDWRDNNWYVSISTFWKEFRRHKIGILGVVILGLFCAMAITAPLLATHDPSPNNRIAPTFLAPDWMSVFDPEGVVTSQVVPDPTFSMPSNYTIEGENPEQFSYSHNNGSDGTDSYSALTWTYNAGDGLNWTEDPEEQLPDVENYIYISQTFTWDWERMPSDVNVSLDFSTHLTGDFDSDEYGGLMFKVYIWLLDSSGNWQRIYQSFPPYSSNYITRVVDLNYFDIAAGWRGLVEGPDGLQDDPSDELTVAVGLSPTFRFENFSSTLPWMNYTGSVTIQLNQLDVVAYGDYFGILGTTDKGADAWSQLVYGSRISLTIGILATALSTSVGVIVGLVAGYFGGKTDEVLMRIVDFLLVIPGLPLMMVLAAFLGPTIENIIVVIAILGWTG